MDIYRNCFSMWMTNKTNCVINIRNCAIKKYIRNSGVFRGWTWSDAHPPSGRRLIFSACNNLYRKNIGIFPCESSSKESRILSVTATETLNSIMNPIVTSLVPKIVVVVFKILVNSRKLLGFTFYMFSIFIFLKNAQWTVPWRHDKEEELVHLYT